MCVALNAGDFNNYQWDKFFEQPYAPQLLRGAVEFRNGDDETTNIAGIARIVGGELLFPAVAIAALVEGVVRAVFCLLAVIPSLLCGMPAGFDRVFETLALSVIFAEEIATRSIKGFVISPFNWSDMTLEQLSLGCEWDCSSEESE